MTLCNEIYVDLTSSLNQEHEKIIAEEDFENRYLKIMYKTVLMRALFQSLQENHNDLEEEIKTMIDIIDGREVSKKQPSHEKLLAYTRNNNCTHLSFKDDRWHEYYFPNTLSSTLKALFSESSTSCIPAYFTEDGVSTRCYLERSKIQEIKRLHPEGTSDELCNICMDKSGYFACGNQGCHSIMCWTCSANWFHTENRCPFCRRENFPLSLRTA
jgi:hypothetical protein